LIDRSEEQQKEHENKTEIKRIVLYESLRETNIKVQTDTLATNTPIGHTPQVSFSREIEEEK